MTVRDADCEVCGFGAMAAIIAVKDSSTVSVCGKCCHVQVMLTKEACDRGLTFEKMKAIQTEVGGAPK